MKRGSAPSKEAKTPFGTPNTTKPKHETHTQAGDKISVLNNYNLNVNYTPHSSVIDETTSGNGKEGPVEEESLPVRADTMNGNTEGDAELKNEQLRSENKVMMVEDSAKAE